MVKKGGASPRGLTLALGMLERLADVGDDLNDVLDRVLAEVVRTTGADRGFLLLREVQKGLVVYAARDERGQKIPRDEREVSRALARRAADENETLRITHAGIDPRFAGSESIKRLGVRSAIASPLVADDERFGAVVVDRRVAGSREFGEQDEKIVDAFARAASRLILSARRIDVERGRARALEQAAAVGLGAERPTSETDDGGGDVDRGPLIGESESMRRLSREIARLKRSNARLLIVGESGSGKELVARAVHRSSPRAREAFVAVNCGALSDALLEDELFGHSKGAFTGAAFRRGGLFVEANKGTLFLDEVGEASPKLQTALLRVIETGEIRPLGGAPRPVDVRLIAATHRDLARLVAAGRFRHDLFFRLDVVRLRVPPLRERIDDVPALARAFAAEASDDREARSRLDPVAIERLKRHSWPGNVRELKNVVTRLVTTGEIAVERMKRPRVESNALPTEPLDDDVVSLAEAERRAIIRCLEATRGNVKAAARRLAISRRGLYYLMERHQIHGFRTPDGDPLKLWTERKSRGARSR